MFTNQKILGLILILFVIGTSVYFAVNKFKQDVNQATATPSPSPSGLSFVFDQNPASSAPPTATVQSSGSKQGPAKPSPQPSVRPLEKVKHLSGFPGILAEDVRKNKAVVIETAKGTIAIQIFPEVPQTSSNFLLLAANGFYDGLKFHRVEERFVIQGGDPNGDGTGGPGYTFADEPVLKDYTKGTVAMANGGPNTNGSQFFIMLADHPELPKLYTIFGQVISGMDVVDKLVVGDIIQKAIIQNLQ